MIFLVMLVTAYVPGAGYPNGGLTGAYCVAGNCKVLAVGDCACGPSFEFGTTFIVDGEPFICYDRGGAIGKENLDLVFRDLESAFQWGRRSKLVEIWKPGAYRRLSRELKKLE